MTKLPLERARQPLASNPGVDGPGHLRRDAHRRSHRYAKNVFDVRRRQGATLFGHEHHTGRPYRRAHRSTQGKEARPYDEQRVVGVGRDCGDELGASRRCIGADASAVHDDRARIGGEQRGERRGSRQVRHAVAARQQCQPRTDRDLDAGESVSGHVLASVEPIGDARASGFVRQSEHRRNVTRKIHDERAGRTMTC